MLGENTPSVAYHLFAPSVLRERRLLVCVHGVTSNPAEQMQALLLLAAEHGVAVLTPEFPRPDFQGYQRLASIHKPLGAAEPFQVAVSGALRRLDMEDVPIDMMGFSGGAQFVHRYAMVYPERVRRLVVAAAGWYTYLDPARRFPNGVAASPRSGGRAIDVERFLQIPVRVMVGERDTERDTQLKAGKRIDREQGTHRLERAIRWVEHLRTEAKARRIESDISLELLPRVAHSFREAMARARFGHRVFEFLAATPLTGTSPAGR